MPVIERNIISNPVSNSETNPIFALLLSFKNKTAEEEMGADE